MEHQMSILKNIELRMAVDRALAGGSAAGEWRLDPGRTGVWFRAKALWGLRSAKGTFRSVSGGGRIAPDGLVSGAVVIRADSVNTGNARWDERLRSKRLLAAADHPELTLTVAGVDRIGNGRLLMTATLTVAGTAKPIMMNTEVVTIDDTDAQLLADFVVSRSDLGLGRSGLGPFGKIGIIGDKVHVNATIHFSFVQALIVADAEAEACAEAA
jgi:polyisoprenoid-binding protein YceI